MIETEHLDTIKRFLHSQERLMLIIGEPGSANPHPLDNLVHQLRLSRHIIRVKGNAQLQPSQIVELLSKNWAVKVSHTKARLELQLLEVISGLTNHDQNCLLIIDDAHTLTYAILAALCVLNTAQEGQKVHLHLLLSGQSSLLEKIARMQIKQVPKITLGALSHKSDAMPADVDYVMARVIASEDQQPLQEKTTTLAQSIVKKYRIKFYIMLSLVVIFFMLWSVKQQMTHPAQLHASKSHIHTVHNKKLSTLI